jgi:acid stress chaperone HdeB
LATALLATVSAWPAKTQVVIDMSLITCKQYLTSDPERRELIASWMSGYLSASKSLNMLDPRYVERNRRVVGAYCKTRGRETLMSAIRENAR